jgi:hypothetical protein
LSADGPYREPGDGASDPSACPGPRVCEERRAELEGRLRLLLTRRAGEAEEALVSLERALEECREKLRAAEARADGLARALFEKG